MALRGLIAAGALALAASAAAQTDTAGSMFGQADADEATMLRDRHERMTIPVTIGGAGPYRFLIDTGAQATVVTHELVEDLALRHSGRARLVAMGATSEVDTVELDDLEFANRSVSGLISPALDATHIGADGILGLDSLQGTRVLLDFREGRMKIADAPGEQSNSGYEIIVRARRKLGQMIITDARVDGVRTAVIIDTGAQASMANNALLRRIRTRERGEVTSIDVLGTLMSNGAVWIRRLEIGGAQMNGVPVAITDSPIFAALGIAGKPALILGVANLRAFDRVAIDFSNQRILFDVPSGSVRFSQGLLPSTAGRL
ncbi:MAG: aspartyl protease family protein [Erythrobacter sp.]